jgi:hypothetical protein
VTPLYWSSQSKWYLNLDVIRNATPAPTARAARQTSAA